MPESRAALNHFLEELGRAIDAARAADGGVVWAPSVQAMADLIYSDSILRMYVEQMLAEVPQLVPPPGQQVPPPTVTTITDLLDALNVIVGFVPSYYPRGSLNRNFFPMSSLFGYMMMTVAGEALFRNRQFNAAIQAVLAEWSAYLDSPASTSVLNTGPTGWLSPAAVAEFDLGQFVEPPGGWPSFNAFFHREIDLQYRPIGGPGDPSVVVSANDGNLVSIARGVQATDMFWLKGQPFSLFDMLNGNVQLVEAFAGGDVVQIFLSGGNYHRWRAPIAGTVVFAQVVNGLMFSDAESAGWDPNSVLSEGYYASVNTRGIVVIDSGDPVLGIVCVMPIGITEISSVTINVQPGQQLAKGDELGYFSYGGSSMCLIFQPGAIAEYTLPPPPPPPIVDPSSGPPVFVNAQIAVANL